MADKQIALGTLLKTDITTPASFVTHTLVKEITPPPRVREEIDGKDLGDTFDVPLLGIEQVSKMTFKQYWHPGDTEHEKMDTVFGSKVAFDVQIVTPHTVPKTDKFTVKVIGLTPETLSTGGVYSRDVELLRTSSITRS